MSKNETLVKAAVFTLLTSWCASVFAQNGPTRYDRDGRESPFGDYCRQSTIEALPEPKRTQRQQKCDQGFDSYIEGLSPNSNMCRNAVEDYRKAKSEAISACHGISQASDIPGNIGCSHAIEKCQCLDMSASSRSERPLCSRGEGISSRPSMAERFAICPAEAAKDIDKLEKEVQEARKALDESLKKLDDAEDKSNQAEKGGNDKMQTVRDQMFEAAKEHAEKLKEAKRAQEDAQNQLAQQLLQFEEQMAEIENRRGEVSVQRHQAKIKYDDAVMQIELQCHADALGRVTKLQEAQQAEIMANVHNRGGFGDMLKNVGKTDRDRWQRVAERFHRQCVRSKPTRDSKNAAAKILEGAYKEADKQEWKINADRKVLERRMNKIRNGGACSGQDETAANGESGETGMCQARRRAVEDAQMAAKLYAAKQFKLRQDAAAAAAEAAKQQAQVGKGLGRMTNNVTRDQGRLNELEALLALKKRYAGNTQLDKKDLDDAKAKNSKLKEAAGVFVNCELKKPLPEGAAPDTPKCSGECRRAADYLYSIGVFDSTKMSKIRDGSATPDDPDRTDNPEAEATPEN